MRTFSGKQYLFAIGISIFSLVLSEVAFQLRVVRQDPNTIAKEVNEEFVKLDYHLIEMLSWFSDRFVQVGEEDLFRPETLALLTEEFRNSNISFFVYNQNQLVFWSSNAIPIPEFLSLTQNKGILELGNGWYFFRSKRIDGNKFMVVSTIKTNFEYQNDFLVNRFHDELSIAQGKFSISGRLSEGIAISDSQGDYIFSLVQRNEATMQQNLLFFNAISFASGLFSVFLFLISSFLYFYFVHLHHPGKLLKTIISFGVILVVVRLSMQAFTFPSVFYESQLFSPSLYATSLVLPSLGDFALHLIIVGIWVFFAYQLLSAQKWLLKANSQNWFFAIGAMLLLFMLIFLSITLFRSLVIDSRLTLDVSFILNFDWYSTLGFVIIGGILFTYLFSSLSLMRIIQQSIGLRKHYLLFILLSFASIVAISFSLYSYQYIFLVILLFLSVVLVHEVSVRFQHDKFNFSPVILALFLFSAIGTYALYNFNGEKETEMRKSMALQLSTDQDMMAEYLFREIEESLASDRQLANLIAFDPYNAYAIEQYLQHHYFYDFWGNYYFHAMVCLPEEILWIRPQNMEVPCWAYFDQYIAAFGRPTLSENLVYLESVPGRNNYIAILRIPVTIVGGFSFYYLLILEFNSKHIIRDLGLPELLIDDRIDVNRELINYSYATYYEGELVNKFGPFGYSINISAYGNFDDQFESFYFDNFDHIVYRKDESTKIVVSKPSTSFLEAIAPFSILFLLFFIFLLGFLLVTARTQIFQWFRLTFKRRVQAFMIVLVILAAVTIGGVSMLFMADIYKEKTLSDIDEKTTSILIDLEQRLANEPDLLNADTYHISDMLLNLYHVLFSDINLFNSNGHLVASSRPRIFEEQIVGSRMDPAALAYFRQDQKSQLVHNEQIGKMEFLSSYVPLRNSRHDLIGYINLPYFARQEEMRREVAYFILAFVNINLLLLFFAILLALTVSKYITRPLELIRSSIAKLQLGGVNQKISWDSEDEIGQMVKEYNRMINELAISADLLAKTERELAWREMAKQVAHEIKNPLTPMKLSVQHLQKAWEEGVPDWNERLERFTKTMVEQVDNLALIAGEFSNFAKLPSGSNGPINLKEFVPEMLGLYSGMEKVKINYVFPPLPGPLYVLADRNQLLRVFNNLLRNSLQAYEKEDTAIVQIVYEQSNGQIICHVCDFGCGIPESLKPRMFSPNFTTKTGGMGLGLPMVKAIVESLGGSISFQSLEKQGTTITFSLPEWEPDETVDSTLHEIQPS